MQRQKMYVNGQRLQHELEQFANYGRTDKNGVTRLALSKEDEGVRQYFRSCCEALGMVVTVDDMGCMYATLAGQEEKPPIVLGSHLDTVKQGGRFDGVLGVVAGLEIARVFVENNITPRIPLMIANFTNEEGARFEPSMMASGVLSGKFEKSKMLQKRDIDGITFQDALESSGYAGSAIHRLKEATAYMELHIEQGPVLEKEGISIGVVDCVVGMVCYEITVEGDANHAGTTPMSLRRDALVAAMDTMAKIRKELHVLDDELVFTVGRMNVFPNIHTVIPNRVVFTLEARHRHPAVMEAVEDVIRSLPHCGGTVSIKRLWDRDTVLFAKSVCDTMEHATKMLGYSYKKMASGAGHDAQFLASYVPAAMLFVPSVDGKSHCEEELTHMEDCARGVQVLLESVCQMMEE